MLMTEQHACLRPLLYVHHRAAPRGGGGGYRCGYSITLATCPCKGSYLTFTENHRLCWAQPQTPVSSGNDAGAVRAVLMTPLPISFGGLKWHMRLQPSLCYIRQNSHRCHMPYLNTLQMTAHRHSSTVMVWHIG